jgi:hypothetical protein
MSYAAAWIVAGFVCGMLCRVAGWALSSKRLTKFWS